VTPNTRIPPHLIDAILDEGDDLAGARAITNALRLTLAAAFIIGAAYLGICALVAA
jgi:hypothetical protein